MDNDIVLIFSLISLGFFGGFTHCSGMCGPFVITQVSQNLQKVPLEKFYGFQKLKNFALLPYHFGRITTYVLIGLASSFLTQNINDLSDFKFFAAFLLFAASLFFLTLLFERKLLRFKLPFLERLASFFLKKLSLLFSNSLESKGYILGLILGFIPCGLLYGAFLIAASISNPLLAASGMLLFGIATFPALFLSGFGGNFLIRFSGFKFLTKIIIAVNAIMLLLMAFNLITT